MFSIDISLSSIFKESRASVKERDFDSFKKQYCNLLPEECANEIRLIEENLEDNCRLVILKREPLLIVYDSAKGKSLKSTVRGSGGFQEKSVAEYSYAELSELAFGCMSLNESCTSTTSMKMHILPRTENVLFSMVSRIRPCSEACFCQQRAHHTDTSPMKRVSHACTIPKLPRASSDYCSATSGSCSSLQHSPHLPYTEVFQQQSPLCPVVESGVHDATFMSLMSPCSPSLYTPPKYPDSFHQDSRHSPATNKPPCSSASPLRSVVGPPFLRCISSPSNEKHPSGAHPETKVSKANWNSRQGPGHTRYGQTLLSSNWTALREDLAVCLLCAPPQSYRQLYLRNLQHHKEKPVAVSSFWTELASSEKQNEGNNNPAGSVEARVILSRWEQHLGSPFNRQLLQHMDTVEDILQSVMHHTLHSLSRPTLSALLSASPGQQLCKSLNATPKPESTYSHLFHDIVLPRLHHTPRLPHPLWLTLSANRESVTAISTWDEVLHPNGAATSHAEHQRQLVALFVTDCLLKLVKSLHSPTLGKKSLLCRLLTAVLTHHPHWVRTVTPSRTKTTHVPALNKQEAELRKNMDYSCHPERQQLHDLFGSYTTKEELRPDEDAPRCLGRRFNRTAIFGQNRALVENLLYLLSYFIRCSNVSVSEERVPQISGSDLCDLRLRSRCRSISLEGGYTSRRSSSSQSRDDHSPHSGVTSCSIPFATVQHPTRVYPPGVTESRRRNAATTQPQLYNSSNQAEPVQHYRSNTLAAFMEVPLLLEVNRVIPDELCRTLCPELRNTSLFSTQSPSCSVPPVEEDVHSLSKSTSSICLTTEVDVESPRTCQQIFLCGGESPLASSSVAHTMFLAPSPRYVEGNANVLQGVTSESLQACETKMAADLQMAVTHHSCLQEPLREAALVVADLDTNLVKVFSYPNTPHTDAEPPHIQEHILTTGSTYVSQILDTWTGLDGVGLPAEVLLHSVENSLLQLFHRGACLSQVLFSSGDMCDQMLMERNVLTTLGAQEDDVPLLMSIAYVIYNEGRHSVQC